MESWPSQFSGPVKLSDRWSRLVNVLLGDGVDAALQNCIKRGCPFGNEKWTEAITQKLELQMTSDQEQGPKKVPDTNGTVMIFAGNQRELRYFT